MKFLFNSRILMDQRLRNIQHVRFGDCRGSIAFMLAAVLLPFLFLLFALSIDVTRFLREEQLAQKRVDDAALFAYRFLPFQHEAETAARNYLSQFESNGGQPDVAVDGDSVTVRYQAHSVPTFAQFFVPQTLLNYSVLARARGTPFDTFIMMDAGAYLAPDTLTGTPWGDEGQWPAASFFENEYKFKFNGVDVPARLVTQQCFNPLFSAVKLTSIQVYEYLAGFRYNSVGVGIFPGSSGAWVDTVRPMQFGARAVLDDAGNQWGEASFKVFNVHFGSSELCAAAAERELSHLGYRFPQRAQALPGLWQPPDGAPQMIASGNWRFNSDYRQFMKLSESLWSRVAHQEAPNSDEVLLDLYSRILPVQYQERGGLMNESRKTGIIIGADVPYAGGARFAHAGDSVATALADKFDLFRTEILNNQNYSISIYFAVLESRMNASDLADVSIRLDELEAFLAAQQLIDGQSNPRFELRLIRAPTPDALSRAVGAHLVLDKKTTVLSR